MTDLGPSCGLWQFAFIDSAVFTVFAVDVFKPQPSRNRQGGAGGS